MADPSIQDLVRQEAIRQGLPPEYALAVAERESGFDPTKPGTSGELGVMQLMPDTAKRYKVNAADPVQNIRGGVQHLRYLMDRFNGDRENMFAAYNAGEGRATQPPASTQQYVQDVLRLVQKYQAAPPTPTSIQESPASPSGLYGRAAVGQAFGNVVRGFNPLTPEGRRNLAGMGGSMAANAALTAAFPEISAPANAALWSARALRTLTPIVGAYLGGAGAQGAEQVAAGGPPSPTSMMQAGGEQARMEAGGQVIGRGLQLVGRRLSASTVSDKISKALTATQDALTSRLKLERPAVSPSTAGQLFDAVAGGPAKSVKDQLGQDVEAAAATGPDIATAPLLAELDRMGQSITPMPSHPPTGGYFSNPRQQLAVRQQALQILPPDHPLPAVLDQAREVLQSGPTIPFSEAHKIKDNLQSAVNATGNWDRSAKSQAVQITKGFSQTVRQAMASHEPYNDATAAYAPVAKLYEDVGADQLHAAIRKDPGKIVKQVKWNNPQSIQLIKDLTDLPTTQGGQQQGEAAFNAVRSAWTNERLIAKGPEGMASEIEKIEASNAGQEFIQAMYGGDPAGRTQWANLKDIATALRQTQAATAGFAKTDLASATTPSGVVRDMMLGLMPAHTIGKIGAISRLGFGKGTGSAEMLEWASRSPTVTRFVINHILTGPNPGMALADLYRWWNENQQPSAMASHVTPPPKPQSTANNVQQ